MLLPFFVLSAGTSSRMLGYYCTVSRSWSCDFQIMKGCSILDCSLRRHTPAIQGACNRAWRDDGRPAGCRDAADLLLPFTEHWRGLDRRKHCSEFVRTVNLAEIRAIQHAVDENDDSGTPVKKLLRPGGVSKSPKRKRGKSWSSVCLRSIQNSVAGREMNASNIVILPTH